MQSTNSFLDQTVGLYPLGTLQGQQITAKDGYAELFVPVLSDLGFLKKLNLDFGGRYSAYSVTTNATTFKVNMDAQLGQLVPRPWRLQPRHARSESRRAVPG